MRFPMRPDGIATRIVIAALAVVGVVSGLSVATGAAQVTHSFRLGLVIAACAAAAAGLLGFVGLGVRLPVHRSPRRVHCAVDGAPLQPDPRRALTAG